ncbi:MAG: 3-deoxy-manno-octulosonate cytidylyltransferase [Helicobacter sp.]|nr:3-deoxy-manno-octulosonate cytidylyltransferase [Helicobacter sp.]
MKVVGIIPARFDSSRFPGKPLADICGYPMVWWVYQAASKAKLSEIIVATDDKRISSVCEKFKIPHIMTKNHSSGIARIAEAANYIKADFYVQINGDEPLIRPELINRILPKKLSLKEVEVYNIVAKIKDPAELMCPSNIKVVFNENYEVLYMSRSVIPTPYNSLEVPFYKHVGILGYNKLALEFFINSKMGMLEKLEGLETLRFIEGRQRFFAICVESCESLSVDTKKDLEKAKKQMKLRLKK